MPNFQTCYHAAMRQETDLVPYATTRLTGSPLLVLAPHPDDEIFGCGAVLLQGVRAKAAIHVVVVTDGDAQGDPSTRREESKEAARLLGTPEPDFWGFADRSLEASRPDLTERIRQCLITIKPRLILAPSPAELHPDHRAVGLATYRLLRENSSDLLHPDLRLAVYEVSAFLRPNVLIDMSGDWPKIHRASKAFASQNVVRPYLEVLEAMAIVRRLTLPETVSHAAGLHLVDDTYIRTHNVREWAEAIGPTAGLENDDPTAVPPNVNTGPFRRFFDSMRGQRRG